MDSVTDDRFLICRVSPFGNLRINAYVPLPEAYRSLSRPSSAPDAKAFPLRSFQLDHAFSAVLAIISNHAGFNRIFSFAKLFFTLNNFKVFHFRFVCQSSMISHLRLPSVALLFSSLLCSVFKVQKRRFRVRFRPVYRSVVENSGIEPLTS